MANNDRHDQSTRRAAKAGHQSKPSQTGTEVKAPRKANRLVMMAEQAF